MFTWKGAKSPHSLPLHSSNIFIYCELGNHTKHLPGRCEENATINCMACQCHLLTLLTLTNHTAYCPSCDEKVVTNLDGAQIKRKCPLICLPFSLPKGNHNIQHCFLPFTRGENTLSMPPSPA
jgi:hypothetical protein